MKKVLLFILLIAIIGGVVFAISANYFSKIIAEENMVYSANTGKDVVVSNLKDGGYSQVSAVFTSKNKNIIDVLESKEYITRSVIGKIMNEKSIKENNIDMDIIKNEIKNEICKELNTEINDLEIYFSTFITQR